MNASSLKTFGISDDQVHDTWTAKIRLDVALLREAHAAMHSFNRTTPGKEIDTVSFIGWIQDEIPSDDMLEEAISEARNP